LPPERGIISHPGEWRAFALVAVERRQFHSGTDRGRNASVYNDFCPSSLPGSFAAHRLLCHRAFVLISSPKAGGATRGIAANR
jgi:hypothetical protein